MLIVENKASTHRNLLLATVPASLGEAGISKAVYEIDPICDSRWEVLVHTNSRASVFHSTGWLRALRAVYGYEPVVMTTCAPGERLTNGLLFCRIKSWLTGRRLVSLPFSDHCEPLVNSQDEFDAILVQMKREVDAGAWKYVEVRPIGCEPSCFTGLSRHKTYHLHSLNLSPTEGELFRSFHKDCIQRKIRRAERERLQYEEGTSEELLRSFYRLVVMTRRRQNLPPQPLNWFRNLICTFGKDLKIRVAFKSALPVASILTLSHNKSMVYKYGCSNAAFNNLGGTALLFWRTVQEARSRGFEQLELGRSDVGNSGLVAFKEHLGASGRLINYWTYPQGSEGLSNAWKTKLVRHTVSAAPDFALDMVGKYLYRHVG